nr:MAG TPA: hypothetical protein [Inoviridae sp.]
MTLSIQFVIFRSGILMKIKQFQNKIYTEMRCLL